MLSIKNLSCIYDNNVIFENFNLDANEGEIILVTGNSGSGKSSFLKILNGIIPEFVNAKINGEILFNNENLLDLDMTKRSKIISTVFQNPKTQFYCINTTDEIAFGLENRNVDGEKIKKIIDKYSEELDIKGLLNKDIFKLSGGEKQFVAISACACMDNKIYLFDEPSSSLDEKSILWLRKAILNLKKQGKIVIIAEHRLYFLADIFDKLVLIENGTSKVLKKREIEFEKFSKEHNLRSFYKKNLDNVEVVNLLDKKENIFGSKLICEKFKISYNGNEIINTTIGLGEGVNFIIGANGVGKSSFLNKLTNLLKAKGHSYYINEKIKNSYEYMSLVMQDVNYQIYTDTVWNELSIVSENEEEKNKVLKELNLYDKKYCHPQILSGGEKQRLLIGKAKISGKPIVIFDEPTSGLDKNQMLRISKYLKEMEKEGRLIIVVTHDYELIKNCDGRVIKFTSFVS